MLMTLCCIAESREAGWLRVTLSGPQLAVAYLLLDQVLLGQRKSVTLMDAGRRMTVALSTGEDCLRGEEIALTAESLAYLKHGIAGAVAAHPHCSGMHCDLTLHTPGGGVDLCVDFTA